MIFGGPEHLPRCTRCQSQTHVISGDGPAVCEVCILALGRAVRDPGNAGDTTVGTLAELHADVVELVTQDGVISWKWTADWPGVRA